ncbi:hypothetical protein ACS0TY_011459 [Phlomoides rotata]
MHALPAMGNDIIIISSDDDSEDGMMGFDSDVEFSFSDDDFDVDDFLSDLSSEPALGEIVDGVVYMHGNSSKEEVASPTMRVPIISASWTHLNETWRSIPYPTLRDCFTTSDDESD